MQGSLNFQSCREERLTVFSDNPISNLLETVAAI